jgi:hypothetical protein
VDSARDFKLSIVVHYFAEPAFFFTQQGLPIQHVPLPFKKIAG